MQAISTRTGTALPSLLTSFAILHELSAILPLVGVFYAARSFGVGERVLKTLDLDADPSSEESSNWLKGKSREWIRDGESWAQRVGARYDFLGWNVNETDGRPLVGRLTGDIANAVVAYGATKVSFIIATHFSEPHALHCRPCFHSESACRCIYHLHSPDGSLIR